MQLRGWGLTRASRIVIILLVVQHLGTGQVLAIAPATTGATSVVDPAQAIVVLDTVVSSAILPDAGDPSITALGEYDSRAIPPDATPLPRRLPRAPPAV
jgi:hypothetical protein